MPNQKNITIAIDGYSSCGKSTFAKLIAKRLNFTYIDTGAMYRAVTLFAIDRGLVQNDHIDTENLIAGLGKINIDFTRRNGPENQEVLLNGINVEKQIRDKQVASFVSPVSAIKEVRSKMVDLQRTMAANSSVVLEGRDIGTVVLPDASIKIFMTASPEVRAMRRFRELETKGYEADFEEVKKNILERDHLDQTRKISPLKKAPDALLLDNSSMEIEEQWQWFIENFGEIAGINNGD
ncbi:MAG: (d)CMP kinase [Bacteroidales bacterium]